MSSYSDLITEARELLQDTDEPQRFSDSYLINTLNRGLQELGRIRPDAFYALYDANALNVPSITDTDPAQSGKTLWTDDFGIDMQFYTPLVSYVVGSAEITEDEFTLEGRAIMMLQNFRNTVIGL